MFKSNNKRCLSIFNFGSPYIEGIIFSSGDFFHVSAQLPPTFSRSDMKPILFNTTGKNKERGSLKSSSEIGRAHV